MTNIPETTPFLELVAKRHSCRAYDPDKPVADADLHACLEAARLAPSACNRQPWRFVSVRNGELRKELCDSGLMPGINHDWLRDAPVIVALAVDLGVLTHKIAPKLTGIQYYMLDAGIAGEHFVLAATERDLGTCWIGWIRPRKIRRILGLPRFYKVVSLIALGHPCTPIEDIQEQSRLPIEQIHVRSS